MNIRETIVAKRRNRIKREGHTLGARVPAERVVPLVPFCRPPGVICEVKRRSPSKGDISAGLDPVKQTTRYAGAGITSVSVLTEEDYFAGSLADLIDIKEAHPQISVLRKDFLIDIEDIDVSYRAGADAVLLIASVLDSPALAKMYAHAVKLGMTVLVEVHDDADTGKVRSFSPQLIGINSRNLETFAVDPIHPIALKAQIDWETKLVYESGIRCGEDARLAAASGFDFLLVGEAVVREPELIGEIIYGFAQRGGCSGGRFWTDLYGRIGLPGRGGGPLVKICGLTNAEDVDTAVSAGADALGFIFARSPRRADAGFVRSLGRRQPGEPARVGVVVSTDPADPGTDAVTLLEDGFLDAIQFHGNEAPEECQGIAFPYFKTINPARPEQTEQIDDFFCPRVLVDAYVPGKTGGTGVTVSPEIAVAARRRKPLWLAGGLNPGNIEEIVRRFCPELVDMSTGVEKSPGIKDHAKLRRVFEQVRAAGEDL